MILKEIINDDGYINTIITTESLDETKVIVRVIRHNQQFFKTVIYNTANDKQPLKWCITPDKITVYTNYYKDVLINTVVQMIQDVKRCKKLARG